MKDLPAHHAVGPFYFLPGEGIISRVGGERKAYGMWAVWWRDVTEKPLEFSRGFLVDQGSSRPHR